MLFNLYSIFSLRRIFVLIISILWISILLESYSFEHQFFSWGKVVHETGELGWNLLIFTIFVSLFQKLTMLHFSKYPKFNIFTKLLPLRKYSGVFAFLIIATHGMAYFFKKGIETDFSAIISASFSTHHAMVFGTISFLVMLPLFLTSTDWAVKKMGGRAWKNLQKFTHVAFVFAVLHVALLEFFGRGEIDFEPIGLLIFYIGGYFYLWWKKRGVK